MEQTSEYQVGDCVRLRRNLLMAGEGTEGVIQSVVRDAHQQITALTILVTGDCAHTYGTTVFPHEVEVIQRAATTELDDR